MTIEPDTTPKPLQPWPKQPKPLKPDVRYLSKRKPLTTIIAIKCKDGVVLCADRQSSDPYSDTKDYYPKIKKLNDDCFFACSGTDCYIEMFAKVAESTLAEVAVPRYWDIEKVSNVHGKAIDVKCESSPSCKNSIQANGYPAALFITAENRAESIFHIYELYTPHAPKEFKQRDAIGSGGSSALVIMKMAEKVMERIRWNWNDLTTDIVAKFCGMVIIMTASHDLYTGQIDIQIVDTKGNRELGSTGLFKDTSKRNIVHLVEMIYDELPLEKKIELINFYGVDKLLQRLMTKKDSEALAEKLLKTLSGSS